MSSYYGISQYKFESGFGRVLFFQMIGMFPVRCITYASKPQLRVRDFCWSPSKQSEL